MTSNSLQRPSLATMLVVIPHSPTKELASPPVCRLCSQEGSPDLFLFIVQLFKTLCVYIFLKAAMSLPSICMDTTGPKVFTKPPSEHHEAFLMHAMHFRNSFP